ncbi:MAG: hypothetical protein R3F13_21790 [Prosthecobacter sp.]
MHFSFKSTAAILAITTSGFAQSDIATISQDHHHHHLPIGLQSPMSIMGDHIHQDGDWMLSYRYMFMDMDGMRQGTHRVSSADVFANRFAVTPERMTMDMHMVGIMYSASEKFTLMAMFQYKNLSMDHRINPAVPGALGGTRFTTETEGVGDTVLTGVYKLYDQNCLQVLGGLGLSLPTASISEKDGILTVPPPAISVRQLPAAMQLGSGTFDFLPMLTVTKNYDQFMLGAQARGTIRTGRNHHDYRFGNAFDLDTWCAWAPARWCSLTAGLGYHYDGQLRGRQSGVATASPIGNSVPTAYGENY